MGRPKGAPFRLRRSERVRFRNWLLAVALLLPFAAKAQPFQGFYIGAGAGDNLPEHYPVGSGQLSPHGGFGGVGSVGYVLGNGFRFEVEGNYREAPLHVNNALYSNGGHVDTYGAMANVLFDMDVGIPWIFPYVG